MPVSRRRGSLFLKRLLDVLVAACALVLLAPVLLVVALVVWLDSPGPVFFRQTRIGMSGRPFEICKFRTMVHDASPNLHREFIRTYGRGVPGGEIHKLAGDPRVTRAGRFLRSTSLDELPQLFNVLAGDMSLVGPRPAIPYEVETYQPWQLERLNMPQGMTGLWQVSGRNRLSYSQMHALDLQYVQTWSLMLDLKILARTIRAVLVAGQAAT
jgi:lipopolysaccharide/colanic/teichoic acid biosynthesis glycosyltransferase